MFEAHDKLITSQIRQPCLFSSRKLKAADSIFKGMWNNILLCFIPWSGYFVFKHTRHSAAQEENGSGKIFVCYLVVTVKSLIRE